MLRRDDPLLALDLVGGFEAVFLDRHGANAQILRFCREFHGYAG
jgi:hypothetical protein